MYYINFNIYGKISTSHVAHTRTHTHSLGAHMVRKTANGTERARESKRWHLSYDVLSVVALVVVAAAVVTFCFHRSFCRRMTS